MLARDSPLMILRGGLAAGDLTPTDVARKSLVLANANASHNTYLHLDPDGLIEEAREIGDRAAWRPLYGIPISLKDCFDLAGTRTTFGTRFYAEHNPAAVSDSAVAARLRGCGAMITGKTHLHPLAYGITGQNPDFGDCLQPRDAALLTGGSSSGAAASVQEGSALAAIGTDTGGSIRVPAALCGLVGYRASHSLAAQNGLWPEMWQGAWALAPSFDTLGVILRDPRDAAPLAEAIFRLPAAEAPQAPRIGCVPLSFLHDAADEVIDAYEVWKNQVVSAGAELGELNPAAWADGIEVFTAIQAHEASLVHDGHYDEFGPLIEQRLEWGASITPGELAGLRARHAKLRSQLARLFASFDFLMLPCAHVSRLDAVRDHATTRAAILRYTVPFSLGGVPVISLPGELAEGAFGTGVQIAAAQGNDAALLAFAREIGERLAAV